jgi:hypothetical protein
MFVFQILNNFEIWTYLNFVQIRILFKIKICLNSKSKHIWNLNLFKFQKRKYEKEEKEKKRYLGQPNKKVTLAERTPVRPWAETRIPP